MEYKRFFNSTNSTWNQLIKVNDVCHLFEELPNSDLTNKSFTTSYAVENQAWVFFHDYIPNFYFHTREKLFSSWRSLTYKHNHTNYGVYYDPGSYVVPISEIQSEGVISTDPIDPIKPVNLGIEQFVFPFFIDVVFKADTDLLLETVNWVSTVLDKEADEHDVDSEWNTLTHITVWNSQQHTGRIALKDVFKDLQQETNRKTQGKWSFNDFRNVVAGRGTQFLTDLFNNYALDPATVEEKAWYEKELLQDKYMIVRFEFDNFSQKQLILHEAGVSATKQMR
jgi:hypothetical protein